MSYVLTRYNGTHRCPEYRTARGWTIHLDLAQTFNFHDAVNELLREDGHGREVVAELKDQPDYQMHKRLGTLPSQSRGDAPKEDSLLKYEHIEPGTRVRAYDFEPMQGREERFVEGVVSRHDWWAHAKVLVIDCDRDTLWDRPPRSRVGEEVFVPMETSMEDSWDTPRVQVIS